MSRNAIMGAVVVVIGAIVAVIWSQSAQAPVEAVSQPQPTQEVAPTPEVESAVETAVEEAQDSAETASEAAQEAVDAATEAVEEAASGAAQTAQEAVSDAVEGVTNAIEETVGTASEAVAAVTESAPAPEAETGAEATPEADAQLDLETLLTPEGFDVDGVLEAVENSELGGIAKTALSTVVEQVRNNPELTESVITQVKAALGM